jgi:hypothetical protein
LQDLEAIAATIRYTDYIQLFDTIQYLFILAKKWNQYSMQIQLMNFCTNMLIGSWIDCINCVLICNNYVRIVFFPYDHSELNRHQTIHRRIEHQRQCQPCDYRLSLIDCALILSHTHSFETWAYQQHPSLLVILICFGCLSALFYPALFTTALIKYCDSLCNLSVWCNFYKTIWRQVPPLLNL